MISNIIFYICIFILFIAIYFPTRHARYYKCIDSKDVYDNLFFPNVSVDNLQQQICIYKQTLTSDIVEDLSTLRIYNKPQVGGTFNPSKCSASLRVALIIPYRNRKKQLEIFLNYMHYFLQTQELSYKIFLVEQKYDGYFNRAKLLNYGARVAIEQGYPCLILHDVDLIPLNYGNIYACTKYPRHMSSSIDVFRYNLPYLNLFGGAVAIRSDQYLLINGMSNKFVGWGGEDDDFFRRLQIFNLEPTRFCSPINQYIMLPHKKNLQTSKDRFKLLKDSDNLYINDGLNSLKNNYNVTLSDLYTHISVF